MGSISMHVDAFDFFGEDVSRDMVAAVNHEAFLADLLCFMREDGARQARANDEIIILRHVVFSLCDRKRCVHCRACMSGIASVAWLRVANQARR